MISEMCCGEADTAARVATERARSRSPVPRRLTYRDFWQSHEAKLAEKGKRRLWAIIEETGITGVRKSSSKQDLITSIIESFTVDELIDYEKSLGADDLALGEINRLLTQRSNELLQKY